MTVLTAREQEVCRLVCLEYSAKRIGVELGISDRTVEWYIESAALKLGGERRTLSQRATIRQHSRTFAVLAVA